jgi:hypothetical protein
MAKPNPINSTSFNTAPPTLQKRYAYDGSNNCIYQGWAARGKDEGDQSAWTIEKYTYDGSNNCIESQIAIDSWTNRVGADYE